jgi:hypothetical protein
MCNKESIQKLTYSEQNSVIHICILGLSPGRVFDP